MNCVIVGIAQGMAVAKTILIVDDDRDFVQGLKVVLEGRGYRVLTAHDGAAGLNVADRERPDLVLVDMMMPKKSGFLVIEALKSRNAYNPKVIMMTANEGARHRAYAEMLGVDDYLRKPFAIDKLLESVHNFCPPANGAIDPAAGA
jgi:DNA-binding response OmpR family regulator